MTKRFVFSGGSFSSAQAARSLRSALLASPPCGRPGGRRQIISGAPGRGKAEDPGAYAPRPRRQGEARTAVSDNQCEVYHAR